MTYNIFDNKGELQDHFQFVKIEKEIISLKYIDNEFSKNRRLSTVFNYFELRPIVSNYDLKGNYINKNVELILGVSFITGVELRRELKFKCDFEGIVITFFGGSHVLYEDILLIDTSKEAINSYLTQLKRDDTVIEDAVNEKTPIRREHIPQSVKDKVWNRDRGRCVECGSNQKLEFDHIIPFSKGGANTYRNLQLLCEKCNRMKSNKIG